MLSFARAAPSDRALRVIISAFALVVFVATSVPAARVSAEPPHAAAWPRVGAYGGDRSSDTTVSVVHAAPSVPTNGTYGLTVRTVLETSTAHLEVRLRVLRPSGSLMLQKTEVVRNAPAGVAQVSFSRGLADLSLRPDVYPVQVRVRYQQPNGRTHEENLEDRLLVYDPTAPRVPVVLITRVACVPLRAPDGRFLFDPADTPGSRRSAERFSQIARAHPEAGLALAIPPIALEDWANISEGFDLVRPDGVTKVPESDLTPGEYRRALSEVKGAISRGVELVDVPYADPDIAGLIALGATGDLTAHYARGASVYAAVLGTTPAPVTALAQGILPTAVAPLIADREIAVAVADRGGLSSRGKAPVSGAYRAEDGTLTVLASDAKASALAERGEVDEFLERAFGRHRSAESTKPVVAVVKAGPVDASAMENLGELLDTLEQVPWIAVVSPMEAARVPSRAEVGLPTKVSEPKPAPQGYWAEVDRARAIRDALLAAAGPQDRDAMAVAHATLIAESRCWASRDGSWSSADRGRAFSAAAVRIGEGILDRVSLDVKDITLSGQDGKVPVAVGNATEKRLKLRLTYSAARMQFPGGAAAEVDAKPSDTFITVPVDLRTQLSDRMTVTLLAGDLPLDSATVTIRASYLDRLVTVGIVVVLLFGMLLFIRHRVLVADADNIKA